MSRDAFSHDPQDGRDATPRRSPRQRPAPRIDARDPADDDPEIRRRLDGVSIRRVIVVKDRIVNIVAA